jgi:SAM-dependent methyltransferase
MLKLHQVPAQYEIPQKYYLLKLDRLLKDATAETPSPQSLFGSVSDDFWLWLNTQGYRSSPALREILPALPDESVQLGTIGYSGDLALVDGYMVYRWIKEIFESYGGDLATCGHVLDFGCGWGRVMRFFLKDLEPSKLWGIDCNDVLIGICKETNKWCNFKLTDPYPPTSFSDDTFDLVFCYSVFSHLSEDAHLKWLAEFRRTLKPGGILIATTREREFIVHCKELRENRNLPSFEDHLPSIFANTGQCLADYDSGKFCFDTSTDKYGNVSSFMGEACIPKDYVLEHWTKHFTFLDFIQDRSMCSQNVIVVRKPFSNGSPNLQSDLDYRAFLEQQRELARMEAESNRLQRDSAKQQSGSVHLDHESIKQREELERMQVNLAGAQSELVWTQDQLGRIMATRLWRLGILYWRTHSRIKSLLHR